MSIPTLRKLRYLVFLATIAIGLIRFSSAPEAAGRYDGCDDPFVCGPGESCDKPCMVDLFENTCGGYGGEPVDPIRGNCLGECGDGYCNDLNEEDVETCYEDCGECGDSICTEDPESRPGTFCCIDCGSNCGGTPGGYGGSCSEEADCGGDEIACNLSGWCCATILVHECNNCTQVEDCIDAYPHITDPELRPFNSYFCTTSGDCRVLS